MWLLDEKSAMHNHFDKVIFNTNDNFYAIDKSGMVTVVDIALEVISRSLMLLDPCQFLDSAQIVGCSMLIDFASPSLLSQSGRPNLSQLDKNRKLYVMESPTVESMQSLNFKYDPKRLEDLS
jgi:hypothetical protein